MKKVKFSALAMTVLFTASTLLGNDTASAAESSVRSADLVVTMQVSNALHKWAVSFFNRSWSSCAEEWKYVKRAYSADLGPYGVKTTGVIDNDCGNLKANSPSPSLNNLINTFTSDELNWSIDVVNTRNGMYFDDFETFDRHFNQLDNRIKQAMKVSKVHRKPTLASRFQVGLNQANSGQFDAAIATFRKVIKLDRNNKGGYAATSYFNIGSILQGEQLLNAAITNYRSALKFAPNFINARYNLAVALTPSNPKEAILQYRKVIALKANDANSLYNLGLLLYEHGNRAEGVRDIRKAVKISPELRAHIPTNIHI